MGANLESRSARQFSGTTLCLVASAWVCGCGTPTPPSEPARSEEKVAAELEEQRLRGLASLFSPDITRERVSRLLRPKVVGALIPDEERVATFRGLRFEFDEFGNLNRIRPDQETKLPRSEFTTSDQRARPDTK